MSEDHGVALLGWLIDQAEAQYAAEQINGIPHDSTWGEAVSRAEALISRIASLESVVSKDAEDHGRALAERDAAMARAERAEKCVNHLTAREADLVCETQRLAGQLDTTTMRLRDVQAALEKAEEQRDMLKAALLRHGEHAMACQARVAAVGNLPTECDCGLAAALALADEPSPSRRELALEKLNSLPAFDETVLVAPLDEPLDDGLCPTCPISAGCVRRWRNVKSCLALDERRAEVEWLRRAADLEDEVGGFPLETGVILNSVRPKPAEATAPVGRPVSRQEALDASREILLRAEAARLPEAEPAEPDEEKAELRAEVARLTSYVRSVQDDCVVLMERYAKEHSPFKPGEGYEALLHAEELLVKHEGGECSLEQMRQWRRKWLEGRLDEVVRLVERIKRELP